MKGELSCAHSRSRLQRKSDELDEIIAMFAETHAQTVELRRMLERTRSFSASAA
jgi:hypothetical protein